MTALAFRRMDEMARADEVLRRHGLDLLRTGYRNVVPVIQGLEMENLKLNQSVIDATWDNAHLENRVRELEAAYVIKRDKLAESEQENARLEKQIEAMGNELAELHKSYLELLKSVHSQVIGAVKT